MRNVVVRAGAISLILVMFSATHVVALSEAAEAYIVDALERIERAYVRRDQVDWGALRAETLAAAQGAQTALDTHDALAAAVASLGDRHTWFDTPGPAPRGIGVQMFPRPDGVWVIIRVDDAGTEAAAGLQVGDRLIEIDGASFTGPWDILDLPDEVERVSLAIDRPGEAALLMLEVARAPLSADQFVPDGGMLDSDVGYVELPSHFGGGYVADGRVYGEVVQRLLLEQAEAGACGWVVDLRRNGGGNALAMIAGLGPLLGGDALGGTRVEGVVNELRYIASARSVTLGPATNRIPVALTLPNPDAPVALLVSRATNSAGELVTLAARGRPATRTFGEPTSGLTTTTTYLRLFGGAGVVVANGVMIDRSGRGYDEPLEPDAFVAIDWTLFGGADDPVVAAARAWLLEQPGCAGGP
jgi:carboxyl-terminal processing protease